MRCVVPASREVHRSSGFSEDPQSTEIYRLGRPAWVDLDFLKTKT